MLVLNAPDLVSGTFTLEMCYWKLPPWYRLRPVANIPACKPIVGPTSEGILYSCHATSSSTSPSDRDIHMLFDWESSMKLSHAFPDAPVAPSAEATGLDDHPYYTAHDLQLRPRIIRAPTRPGAAGCLGSDTPRGGSWSGRPSAL